MLILGRHLPAAVGWLMSMGWPGPAALSLRGGYTAQLGALSSREWSRAAFGGATLFLGLPMPRCKVRGSSQAASIPCYQPSFCVESGWGINESLSVQMNLLILIPLSLLFPFMDTAGGVGDATCPSSPRAPWGTQSTVRGITVPNTGCVKCQPWGLQG